MSPPVEIGGGQFEATYTAPTHGTPAYVAVAAWDDSTGPTHQEVGVAILAISARIEIPIETEPGAQLLVTIGNRRTTALADSEGHARAGLLVPPSARRARVAATDAAGNTNLTEVSLDMPRPKRLWLIAPDGAAAERRLYFFSAAANEPQVSVSQGATITVVHGQHGSGSVVVHSAADAVVGVSNGENGDAVSLLIPVERSDRPGTWLGPRWELGAAIGPRYSGAFTGVTAQVEGRARIRRLPLHLGADIGALYSSGSGGAGVAVQLGGLAAQVVVEGRLSVKERLSLYCGLGLGGVVVSEQRVIGTRTTVVTDGGPQLSITVGLLARLGPGLLTLAVGFAYAPLVHLDNINVDGGIVSVGYRGARW